MARSKKDIRLGQLLVQKKLCSLRQVNEALLKQRALRHQNENQPLGKILVEGGALDADTLLDTLATMGVLHVLCPSCGTDQALKAHTRGSVHACPKCGHAMELHDGPSLKREDTPVPFVNAPRGERPARLAKADAPNGAPGAEAADRRANGELDAHIGKVLGGCQIFERIARGGMGVVYKARQLNLGRTVAVKVLSDDLASDATFVRRFVQEARSAAQLSHGNVVHVNDVGECQGTFYFVMEYVDGQNLREILREESQLPISRALEITLQVCQALRHAHQKGIIHRDIKPENIMLTRDGVVKLADLGLAKRMATDNSVNLTMAGAVLGTPYYMAPEQAKDFSKVDHRSDIYSLGVTLYRMITGKVPFEGRSPIEVMIKAMDGKKIPVHDFREDVPEDVVQIVDRMMHKNPEKRYQSVGELIQDMASAVHSKAAVETC